MMTLAPITALVEVLRDPRQGLGIRDELLEPQPALLPVHRGDDEHTDRAGLGARLTRGDAADAGGLRRCLAGELRVVLEGDRAIPGAHEDRAAQLGVDDVIALDAAGGAQAVGDPVDIGGRRFEDVDRAGGRVAAPPAACAVVAQAAGCACGRHGAELAQRAVGLADGRAELHLPSHRVEHEVAAVGTAVGEVGDLSPGVPALSGGHLQRCRLPAGHDRPAADREALAGHAFGQAQDLVADDLGVDACGGAPDCAGGQRDDLRRVAVVRPAVLMGQDPAADPAGPLLADQRDLEPPGRPHTCWISAVSRRDPAQEAQRTARAGQTGTQCRPPGQGPLGRRRAAPGLRVGAACPSRSGRSPPPG